MGESLGTGSGYRSRVWFGQVFFFSFGKFVGQVNERQMDLSSEFRRGPRWKTPLEFISMRMASEAMKMDGLTQEVDIREKERRQMCRDGPWGISTCRGQLDGDNQAK